MKSYIAWFAVMALPVLVSWNLAARADDTEGPYMLITSAKVGGEGGFDYVDCDPDTRHLYVVRGGRGTGRISAYDLDTLKLVGEIPNANRGHGVAIDPKSGHAFSSSSPVIMFDSKTLTQIKTIDVQGSPDGIMFEPFSDRIYVLSHREPNVTVINPDDGTVVGTIDLGGGPEQGASDGKGHVYIDVEDQDNVAVVDAKTMQCTGHYDLQGKGSGPGGMAIDAVNGILFSYCHDPAVCVIMNAADGKILTTLPIGNGVDAAEFNPATLESFSSQRDGTLTVIKESSPTSFAVEQNVKTKVGAKCSTLDSKTQQIYLITADMAPRTTQPSQQQAGGGGAPGGGGGGGGGRGRGTMVPGSFTILVVGKGS
jgi:DNA-binding beta-propeller fold protein YncE